MHKYHSYCTSKDGLAFAWRRQQKSSASNLTLKVIQIKKVYVESLISFQEMKVPVLHMKCRRQAWSVSSSQPGLTEKLMFPIGSSAVEAGNLNHWITRDVPDFLNLLKSNYIRHLIVYLLERSQGRKYVIIKVSFNKYSWDPLALFWFLSAKKPMTYFKKEEKKSPKQFEENRILWNTINNSGTQS